MATNTTTTTTPFNHQYYNHYPSSYYSNDVNKTDCTSSFAPPPISSYLDPNSDGFEQLANASIACEQKHQLNSNHPGYNRSDIHETSNLTTTDLSPLENLNWDQTNTASCSILNNTANQQQSNNSSTIDYLTHTEQFYQYDNRNDCGYGTFTDNNVVF